MRHTDMQGHTDMEWIIQCTCMCITTAQLPGRCKHTV